MNLIVRIPKDKIIARTQHTTTRMYWTDKEMHNVIAIKNTSHPKHRYEACLHDTGQWVGILKSENPNVKLPVLKKGESFVFPKEFNEGKL